MDPIARSVTPTALQASDLRRAISRQAWLTNRARNALQRPAFIGAISVGTFVTAIVSLVVVPRAQRQAPVQIPVVARPDTMTVLADAAMARVRLAQSESALVAQRQDAAAAAQAKAAEATADSTLPVAGPQRDSLTARIDALQARLTRAQQAPLPASYRALADLPEMRADPRVHSLVDSLSDIEREREGFGAVGGVDPIFVALTSRANEIGRTLRVIADRRIEALRSRLDGAPPAMPVATAAVSQIDTLQSDTLARSVERDSLRASLQLASDSVARMRALAQRLDREEDQARERATRVAPPLALLASAFVLSAVLGFAVALIGELRRPRVSDAAELERLLGVRVLSTVKTAMPSLERGRREADRAAPPYFDPGAEAYQLAYLGLATEHPAVLTATVTGDDRSITAVVACNLAAVAADEARTTLIVDLEPSCSASAALRARVSPGITDILQTNAAWTEARVAARVGRDKTVDLVPFGTATAPAATAMVELMRQDSSRFARYYDAIVVLADLDTTAAGLPEALPSSEVVYCARPGITPLRLLQQHIESIRSAGGSLRGVVLWAAERPMLPTPRELSSRKRNRPEPALAAT